MFTQNIVAEKSLHNVQCSLFVRLLSTMIKKIKTSKTKNSSLRHSCLLITYLCCMNLPKGCCAFLMFVINMTSINSLFFSFHRVHYCIFAFCDICQNKDKVLEQALIYDVELVNMHVNEML